MSDIDNDSGILGSVEPRAEMQSGSADNILSDMFRCMKSDLNISDALLESAVYRFSMKISEVDDPKKLVGAKSNFLSALRKDTMTIKTLHRGLLIFGSQKYTITITGKRKDGTMAIASRVIHLKNKDFIEPEDDKIDGLLISLFKDLNHISLENNKDFAILFDEYADLVGIPPDNVSRSKERSALKKDLFKAKKITWKNFVKGLLFLGFAEFDIVITISHRNGKTTTHSRRVILREEAIEDNNEQVPEDTKAGS